MTRTVRSWRAEIGWCCHVFEKTIPAESRALGVDVAAAMNEQQQGRGEKDDGFQRARQRAHAEQLQVGWRRGSNSCAGSTAVPQEGLADLLEGSRPGGQFSIGILSRS